tara:strand:- start:303 stop:641 length:339 start_codon:yes stop_codon:yes gene_type:complete
MSKKLADDSKYAQYDADGDGIVSDEELAQAESIMRLDHEKAMLENEDKRADAQRNMAWFALFGMLLYPFAVVTASLIGLETAAATLGDMAPTYFVSVAAIVAAFYAGQALSK